MNKNILISLVFIIFLTFSANAQTSLNGKWKLVSIQNLPVETNISLNVDKNRIGGNGGCNSYGGNLTKKGNKLDFSEIFSTKMWCDNGNIENKYFNTLDKATFYKIRKGQLILLNDKKETILAFVKVK